MDDKNVLISFASFENDGSAKKFANLSNVMLEDRQQHWQYANCDTEVDFHSLKDFGKCENVEEFLEEVRQHIVSEATKVKGSTSLFLQDFPSGGEQISNILMAKPVSYGEKCVFASTVKRKFYFQCQMLLARD